MEGNLITLDNGLIVSVDWLSFTVTSTADVVDVLDMFGYVMDDFTRMPKGARGYKTMFRLNGYSLSVLCDGNSDMGIHIDAVSYTHLDVYKRQAPTSVGCYRSIP